MIYQSPGRHRLAAFYKLRVSGHPSLASLRSVSKVSLLCISVLTHLMDRLLAYKGKGLSSANCTSYIGGNNSAVTLSRQPLLSEIEMIPLPLSHLTNISMSAKP